MSFTTCRRFFVVLIVSLFASFALVAMVEGDDNLCEEDACEKIFLSAVASGLSYVASGISFLGVIYANGGLQSRIGMLSGLLGGVFFCLGTMSGVASCSVTLFHCVKRFRDSPLRNDYGFIESPG